MDLTDEDIAEFQGIWKEEMGEEIDAETARAEARRLLELYACLAGLPYSSAPLPERKLP